ncbi:hypothetical protein [Paralcaligenes ureilyticus]|uniref:PPC domain-containing protein n=1 Tax=Paralcaligenes ureilyticus TaxID=627131 RepID=A0A4R3LYP5_9BURK|nr:hypothetical protein [Paralcaligenes ureilyticus]TCT05782.1 hypothetical protein EDC26_10970 [Paralcaligenes ureilyticus]
MTIEAERVQLLKHAGPVSPVRRDVLAGRDQKTYRIPLCRGETLYASVVHSLKALKIKTAALSIKTLRLDSLRYCMTREGTGDEPLAAYSPPRTLSEPSLLIGSGATVGADQQGGYFIHCHGFVVTPAGDMIGGHFLTEDCLIGEDGVAYLHALDFLNLVIGVDPEVKTTVFQPTYREAHHAPD